MATHKRVLGVVCIALASLLVGSGWAQCSTEAVIMGDGRGKAEHDCFIALGGYTEANLDPINKKGTKVGIVCTDCDPACDLDGVAAPNGVCTFMVSACINNADVEGCDPGARKPKKVQAWAKSKAGKLDLSSTLPDDLTAACSEPISFDVPLKGKRHDRPGRGKVSLKASKPADKDKFVFLCNPRPPGEACRSSIAWAASAAAKNEEQPGKFGFRIVRDSTDSGIQWLTDSEFDDYKPSYSPDGSKLAFFRVVDYPDGYVFNWLSKLMVMSSTGSDERELTDSGALDHVPYWTRDGSDQITFSRLDGPLSQGVYRTRVDATPGEEELLSDPGFIEMGYSSLRDGRILVRREFPLSYLLLTPVVGGTPVYEEISYPFEGAYLHKMSISASETKIAYMKVEPEYLDPLHQDVYRTALIAYADFDAANLRIENEVVITEYDESTRDWYPAWTADEKAIVWAHGVACPVFPTDPCDPSGVIKAHFLETGITEEISSHDELEYRYPIVVGTVK